MKNAFGDPQSILLVGGTSEIGVAIVNEFAKQGSLNKVVLFGRNEIKLELIRDELTSSFGQIDVDFQITDMQHTNQLSPLVESLFETHEFDLVILATGLLPTNVTLPQDINLIIETAKVNFLGPIEIASSALNCMIKQGHGVILNVSSIAVVRPRDGMAIYGASKSALDFWIEAMKVKAQDSGVQLVNLRPGMVRTKMTLGLRDAPLTQFPEEVAVRARKGINRDEYTIWSPKKMRIVAALLFLIPRSVLKRIN